MPVTDEDAALQAIATLESLSAEQDAALTAINRTLQDGEPFVDIHELFGLYDALYFRNLLKARVEVIWSERLTLCAGICELSKDPATGKLTRIRLKMSTPLLQYRPRSDTVNTLLHEAIHAYFFITTSWQHSRGDDGTGHGVGFQLLANAINNHGNYGITIFHTFHDEVDSYRTHVWQCDGPCKDQSPYFGLVKRSMNRPPGKYDSWWAKHEVNCGGTYTKIQEPAPTKKQIEAMSKKERAGRQKNKLDRWVKAGVKQAAVEEGKTSRPCSEPARWDNTPLAGRNGKRKLDMDITYDIVDSPETEQKRSRIEPAEDDGEVMFLGEKGLVECPICSLHMPESEINQHLDVVHPT